MQTIEPKVIEGVTLHHASEALQPQVPIPWVVEGLLSCGSVALLVGEGGSKKTYAMFDLAVAVATGTPWLDFPTVQTPVLFIDEESGLARFNRRLGDTLRGHLTGDADVPVWYACLSGFNFLVEPNRYFGALQTLITGSGAKLVIIDAVVEVMLTGDENTVRDTGPVLAGLRKLADLTGCCIVVIHHANKNGGYRGSSALKGAVDLLLTIESPQETDVVTFASEKARDIEPVTFAARAHFEPGQFWLSKAAGGGNKTMSPTRQFVLDYLAENGSSTLEQVQQEGKAAYQFAATSIRDALYELVKLGRVERKDRGKGGEKALYGLVDCSK